jgi:hypothetical protein
MMRPIGELPFVWMLCFEHVRCRTLETNADYLSSESPRPVVETGQRDAFQEVKRLSLT